MNHIGCVNGVSMLQYLVGLHKDAGNEEIKLNTDYEIASWEEIYEEVIYAQFDPNSHKYIPHLFSLFIIGIFYLIILDFVKNVSFLLHSPFRFTEECPLPLTFTISLY